MSNMVKFANPGDIDERVWKTFGMSVKIGDNPIGRFGTGLKYAIAVLLRNNRKITIKNSKNSYEFTTESTDFRGEEFQQILCNGEPLPYTTEYGKNWELWQAYREIFSNCLDEGGGIDYRQCDVLTEQLGYTMIEAQLGDINHNDVFLDRENLKIVASDYACEVFDRPSKWVYYRGIRAYELPRESMFTYNILEAYLTEDRTIAYDFEITARIREAVFSSECPDFLHRFIFGCRGSWEESITFVHGSESPSQKLKDIVSEHKNDAVFKHKHLFDIVKRYLDPEKPRIVEKDERQDQLIKKAQAFCEKIGYPVKYPVHISDNLGVGVLAMADRTSNEIYMSTVVMTQGLKQVVSTLIEENAHLEHGFSDCTYDFQTWLFDQVVTMAEKAVGEYL